MESAPQGPPTDQTNFGLLRLYFQNSFFKYFESIKGKKTVYFDEGLLKVLSFVFGTIPPQANIDQTLPLQDKNQLQPECDKVIFVVRPELDVIRSLIYQQKGWKNDKEFYVLYVPRRTIECDEELEKEKLFSEERVSHIAMDLIPLEEDLLSLEMADNFAHFFQNIQIIVKLQLMNLKYIYFLNTTCQVTMITIKFMSRLLQTDWRQYLGKLNINLPREMMHVKFLVELIKVLFPLYSFYLQYKFIYILIEQLINQAKMWILLHHSVQTKLMRDFQMKSLEFKLVVQLLIQLCFYGDTAIIKPDGQKDPKAAPLEPSKILTLTNDDKIFKDVRDKHFNTLESTFSQKVQQIQSIVKEKDAPQSIDELEAYITKLRNMDIAKGKDILTHHLKCQY